MNFQRSAGVALTLAFAMLGSGCGSAGKVLPVSAPRVIAGVNDHPRNPYSANFSARRAAAHARGLWLTDELNAPVKTGSPPTVVPGRNGQVVTQSYQNGCNDPSYCAGGGESGDGSGSWTALSYDPPLYDTELDYSDGTSMLGLEVDQGQLAVLEDDGFYTAYSFSTITGDLTPHQKYCHVVFSGANDCPTIPKWMCPYDAVGWGIAAKWAVIGLARGKSSPAADYVGGAVAASVAMFCNTYAMRGPWNARRLHLAVRFSRQRSS